MPFDLSVSLLSWLHFPPALQTVFYMVVVVSTVRIYVRGLQDSEHFTAGHQAAVREPLAQGITELLLPTPFADLSFDNLSTVNIFGYVL